MTAFATAIEVYRLVLGRPRLLLRFGGVLLPAVVVLQVFRSLVPDATSSAAGAYGYWLAFLVVGMWFSTLYAVRWHRLTLLGERDAGALDVRFGRREWALAWRSVVLSLVVLPVHALVAAIAHQAIVLTLMPDPFAASPEPLPGAWRAAANAASALIGSLPALYVAARCGLILAAAALDRSLRLRTSWRATSGRGARFTGVLILVTLPPYLVGLAAATLFAGLPPAADLVGAASWCLSIAVTATALSFHYAAVFGWPRAGW